MYRSDRIPMVNRHRRKRNRRAGFGHGADVLMLIAGVSIPVAILLPIYTRWLHHHPQPLYHQPWVVFGTIGLTCLACYELNGWLLARYYFPECSVLYILGSLLFRRKLPWTLEPDDFDSPSSLCLSGQEEPDECSSLPRTRLSRRSSSNDCCPSCGYIYQPLETVCPRCSHFEKTAVIGNRE